MSILVCIERPRYRSTERFSVDDEVSVKINDDKTVTCRIDDISTDGMAMSCRREDLEVGSSGEDVNLKINGVDWEIDGKVVWKNGSANKAGIKFKNLDLEAYKQIVKYIFKSYEGYHSKSKRSGKR